MKTTKVIYICDLCEPTLPDEASTACAMCKKDTCDRHRAWVDTRFQHHCANPPGTEPPRTGFNLCTRCRDELETLFDALRRTGDGMGPTNKELLASSKRAT